MWEKNINKHEEEEETHIYVVVIFSSILYLTTTLFSKKNVIFLKGYSFFFMLCSSTIKYRVFHHYITLQIIKQGIFTLLYKIFNKLTSCYLTFCSYVLDNFKFVVF